LTTFATFNYDIPSIGDIPNRAQHYEHSINIVKASAQSWTL